MQKNHFLSSEMGYKQEVSYKASLNLPFTDFPMKANLPVKEAEILKIWQEKNIYQKIRKNKKNKPKFILHDGPPYANGNIHVGHAVNKTLKDFIIKYKTLFGFDAPYVPGWDCHGLPIELNIEKKYGRVGDKISAKEFREKSRAYAQTQVEKQREDFKRLGVFGDWEKPYQTMGYSFEADVIRALSKIIERGHLHQGFKPVHWCVDCASSLAEAEVEYKEKTSNSLYVLFRVPESECKKLELISDSEEINKDILGSDNSPVFAVIWTTTPWTLPANKAIAVHPEIKYALVKIKFLEKEIYLILAEALIEKALSDLKTSVQIMTLFLGQSLEGLKAEHPFLENLSVPFIMGEHVVCDSGTGLVHTAPAHGVDDFNATRKLNISVESPLDGRGVFLPDTPIVGGCFYEKSNELIIQALLDRSRCLFTKKIQHSYPHCWRHKTPILFRATPQWFVSLSQKKSWERCAR